MIQRTIPNLAFVLAAVVAQLQQAVSVMPDGLGQSVTLQLYALKTAQVKEPVLVQEIALALALATYTIFQISLLAPLALLDRTAQFNIAPAGSGARSVLDEGHANSPAVLWFVIVF